MSHPQPTFVGRRQRRLDAVVHAVVDAASGVGGLTVRYDEHHHYDVELADRQLTARITLPTLTKEWWAEVPAGIATLFLEMVAPTGQGYEERMTNDLIRMGAVTSDGQRLQLAEIDGRFLTAVTSCSFTGRVIGLYCVEGTLNIRNYSERGFS